MGHYTRELSSHEPNLVQPREVAKNWALRTRRRQTTRAQFSLTFGDRFTAASKSTGPNKTKFMAGSKSTKTHAAITSQSPDFYDRQPILRFISSSSAAVSALPTAS